MAEFTAEQLDAIERRDGELLLDASAGSGKTSVLVERFARAVLEDGVDVKAILAITFTDKAAAELRERIRLRLRELGAIEQARATEGAFISTIHGFCARVLRAHALRAGIDPKFVVLDEPEATRLADQAFDAALSELSDSELVASYTPGALRGAILGTYGELRSRGEHEPRLPELGEGPDPEHARARLFEAADAVRAQAAPTARAHDTLARLDRLDVQPWPGELDRLRLSNGGQSCECDAYAAALAHLRTASEYVFSRPIIASLGRLLRIFGTRYAERKRAVSGVDFADLELMVRGFLTGDPGLRERYAGRFAQVMVDELQDTNGVQLSLINLIARDNLFAVGDAQQSIYGFRHADVELFEELGRRLEEGGRRKTLETNFRSRPEILAVINQAFGGRPLRAGRDSPVAHEPLVELIVVDKGEEWAAVEGLGSPWRAAEARALARRVRELMGAGVTPQEVVVLTRATTDLRAYERALEEQGIPTYLIGGRGYWTHPQVMDLVAYLRALANPRDEEAYYQLLASPLVGVSVDALVLIAASIRSGEPAPDGLTADDAERLEAFTQWFEAERALVGRIGIEELIGRALERNAYELQTLALPGGERRLANLRKLMRLGRDYEERSGRDLRGFLELATRRGGRSDPRESEAPVEGEALDAVRLMTIHRAKGLEFEVVVVADLGREPWRSGELLRVGTDGRIGLRLARPGTGRALPALAYGELGERRQLADAAEERRIFYVAMTRARERLILTGAAKLDEGGRVAVRTQNGPCAPINWIAPALADAGVEPQIISSEDVMAERRGSGSAGPPIVAPAPAESPLPAPPPPVTLSYSALVDYDRCAYRFYLERVLGLPPVPAEVEGSGGLERGILVHEILERLDFRRPQWPPDVPDDVARLLGSFVGSSLFDRLAAATEVKREQGFAFLVGDVLIRGALDVLATEPRGRTLIVDYKSDQLGAADPEEVVSVEYGIQRSLYALAALRAGAPNVEVVHLFLERPEDPVSATFEAGDLDGLEREVAALAAGAVNGTFPVSGAPGRSLCAGCPGEGGLCSWPLEVTRRDPRAADLEPQLQGRLF